MSVLTPFDLHGKKDNRGTTGIGKSWPWRTSKPGLKWRRRTAFDALEKLADDYNNSKVVPVFAAIDSTSR